MRKISPPSIRGDVLELTRKINEIVDWVNHTEERLTLLEELSKREDKDYSDLEKRGRGNGSSGESGLR